jgi:hypothetical protein
MPPKSTKKNLELPPKIGTRPENSEAHPGAPVSKRKRRTKAEKQADAEEKQRKKDEEAEKKAAGIKRIAQIEDEVAEQDANLVTPRPKPKPRTAALKRTVGYAVLLLTDSEKQQETGIDEPSEFDPAPQDNDDGTSELTEIEESPKKKVKVSTRGAIQASRRDKSKEDGMNDNNRMDIDGIDKPDGKTAQVKPKRFVLSHMLTLDETTLYYYSMYSFDLKSDARKPGLVKNWVAKTDIFSAPPKSQSGSSRSRNDATSSTLTNRVLITSDRTFNIPSDSDSPDKEELQGGLADEDETKGAERDNAVASPLKGKVRASSTVSTRLSYLT